MPERTLTTPQSGTDARSDQSAGKPAFEEPRLTFVEPKLTPRGDLREVTAGFISGFSP
jgi:hypothetical protein